MEGKVKCKEKLGLPRASVVCMNNNNNNYRFIFNYIQPKDENTEKYTIKILGT